MYILKSRLESRCYHAPIEPENKVTQTEEEIQALPEYLQIIVRDKIYDYSLKYKYFLFEKETFDCINFAVKNKNGQLAYECLKNLYWSDGLKHELISILTIENIKE